jgi:cytochrome c1
MQRSTRRVLPAVVAAAAWAGLAATLSKERLRLATARGRRAIREAEGRREVKARLPAVARSLAVAAALLYGLWSYLGEKPRLPIAAFANVNVAAAPELMIRYGCGGCHAIPGIPGARGQVGPALTGFSSRVYIAGALTNDPGNLVRWLVNPRSLDPRTAMPVTGINEDEARIVAAYLLGQR